MTEAKEDTWADGVGKRLGQWKECLGNIDLKVIGDKLPDIKIDLPDKGQVDALTGFIDQRIQGLGDTLRSELQKTLENSGERVDELAEVLDAKLQALSTTLRHEMEKTMSQYRQDILLTYEKQRRELKAMAFWQWMAALAVLLVFVIRQSWSYF